MSTIAPRRGCRMCAATSYRQVIARAPDGAMRANGLYQCSGCSLVFAHPDIWRGHTLEADAGTAAPLNVTGKQHHVSGGSPGSAALA